MANFMYRKARKALLEGNLDLSSDDLRVILVMTDTSADSDLTAEFVGDLSALDEFDGANYARQPLANQAVAEDVPADRVEFTADPTNFPSLGAGTRQGQAALIYKHVANDADSPIVAYIDSNGFPFTGTGADYPVNWSAADGIMRI